MMMFGILIAFLGVTNCVSTATGLGGIINHTTNTESMYFDLVLGVVVFVVGIVVIFKS